MNDIPPLIHWGRCRTGRRWFWAAKLYGLHADTWLDGKTDTRQEAERQGHLAALQLAGGQYAHIGVTHGLASSRLRELNAAKRTTRPLSDSTEAGPVEYLYGTRDVEDDRGHLVAEVQAFRIIKRTKARVYYARREHPDGSVQLGYVDRQELEAKGEVRNYAAGGWWAADFHLYAKPPEIERPRPVPVDLKVLKAAMADSHPDRGGTDAKFIAARHKYETARLRAGR